MAEQDNDQATTAQAGQAPGSANGNSPQNGATPQNGTAPQNGNGGPAANNGNGSSANNGNANGTPEQQPAAAAEQKSTPGFTKSPLFRIIAVIVVIVLIIWGINFYNYSQNHVTTDDAYVTGDLVNISPIISGTLSQLTVEEGDTVKAGEVIAVLDQSGPLASYDAAKAAYEAALSEVPQAQTNLTYQSATTESDINQARAALAAQNAKTAQQQQQVQLLSQTTTGQVLQAQAQASAAYAQYTTELAQAASAAQAITTSRSAADAAKEQVAAAEATYVKAHNDEVRYTSLYGSNGSIAAVTAEQVDAAVQAADNSHAELGAAQDQYNQAESSVLQAVAQENAARAAASAALKQFHASESQVAIARANQIQVPVQKFVVVNNAAIAQQTAAQLQAAIAGQSQIALKKQQVSTAEAQALQAKASMANAQVTLEDCTIKTPTDGTVVRKGVNVGDALTPGQTIVTITRGDAVWVEANYKETQLQYVRPGQPADVTVDAFPGLTFHGRVQSINEASGNTTSLLPADNATGNFTKVVQRIPVKIVFPAPNNPGPHDATQQDIENLRQGMSVEADIDISSARH